MVVKAKLNYLRIAPRKVRLVVDLIRGKRALEAQKILRFTVKGSAAPVLKLLNSAVANAKHNFQLEEANLYISKILVNEGPKLKRWRPRARGQAYEIQKKTSHIEIYLEEIIKKPKKAVSKKKVKEPEKEVIEVLKEEKPRIEDDRQTKFRSQREMPKSETNKRGVNRIFRRKSF